MSRKAAAKTNASTATIGFEATLYNLDNRIREARSGASVTRKRPHVA